jgi:hypothetical protein
MRSRSQFCERLPVPIKKENRARYPKNWKSEIVPRIRARSENRCECTGQCGIGHTIQPLEATTLRCWAINGEKHPIDGYKVVLTVMHLNHTPEDCADDNLLHGCQSCHLRYDQKDNQRKSRVTRFKKRGQEDLGI